MSVTSSNSKNSFKSKFCVSYEKLFASGSAVHQESRFWRELFLLDVDEQFIQKCVYQINHQDLMLYSPTICGMFFHIQNLVFILCMCMKFCKKKLKFFLKKRLFLF